MFKSFKIILAVIAVAILADLLVAPFVLPSKCEKTSPDTVECTTRQGFILSLFGGTTAEVSSDMPLIPENDPVIEDVSETSHEDVAVSDVKTYSDGKISFEYPKSWKLMNSVEYEKFLYPASDGLEKDGVTQMKPDPRYTYFVSPEAAPGGVDYNELSKGYVLVLTHSEDISADTRSLAEIKAGAEARLHDCGMNPSYDIVDVLGVNVVTTNAQCEGSYESASFVKGDLSYGFRMEIPEVKDRQQVREYMKAILSSITIK